MAESKTHKRAKTRAAGKAGRPEVAISRNRRVDAIARSQAVEVETSGQPERLEKAARRLKASGKATRILVVPQTHMSKARAAIKSARTTGTVRNLSGTKYSRVASRTSSRGTKSNNRRPAERRSTRQR